MYKSVLMHAVVVSLYLGQGAERVGTSN